MWDDIINLLSLIKTKLCLEKELSMDETGTFKIKVYLNKDSDMISLCIDVIEIVDHRIYYFYHH